LPKRDFTGFGDGDAKLDGPPLLSSLYSSI